LSNELVGDEEMKERRAHYRRYKAVTHGKKPTIVKEKNQATRSYTKYIDQVSQYTFKPSKSQTKYYEAYNSCESFLLYPLSMNPENE
jgi:hypothetical protein